MQRMNLAMEELPHKEDPRYRIVEIGLQRDSVSCFDTFMAWFTNC